MGLDAMIFVFWMLSFKPAFSLSSFTFIKRLFSSSLHSTFRVVSSAVFLRLLIILLVILIPAFDSSSLAFLMICSAYKLYKQWHYTAFTYSFPKFERVCCFMSSSNCCFLICIQVSQGTVRWSVFPSLEEYSTVCCDPHSQRQFEILNWGWSPLFSLKVLLYHSLKVISIFKRYMENLKLNLHYIKLLNCLTCHFKIFPQILYQCLKKQKLYDSAVLDNKIAIFILQHDSPLLKTKLLFSWMWNLKYFPPNLYFYKSFYWSEISVCAIFFLCNFSWSRMSALAFSHSCWSRRLG